MFDPFIQRSVDQINRIYNCPSYDTAAAAPTSIGNYSFMMINYKYPLRLLIHVYFSIADLNHAHPNCKMEAEAGTCRSDPNYVDAVCGKSSLCDGKISCYVFFKLYDAVLKLNNHFFVLFLLKIGWGVTYGIPSPHTANLINGLGKCATVYGNSGRNGYNLLQWDCNHHEKGMLWSWNESSLGSGDRHLCNAHGKCAASRANSPSNVDIFQWEHLEEAGQRFYFLDSLAHPGFYLIRNDHGKCMAVPGNTDRNGAEIHARDCNVSEAGQHWKWNSLY